uniref:Uncharacterized protein n=1 Tax=viral metagenome TaxID=1070528 RepID=A0A6H1ZUJ5_9ZZZZ
MSKSLQEIQERSQAWYNQIKKQKRESYRYAKELGFTAQEAQVLAGFSKKKILEFSKEKEKL